MKSEHLAERAVGRSHSSNRLDVLTRASLVIIALSTASCQTARVSSPPASVPQPVVQPALSPELNPADSAALSKDTVDLTQSEVTGEAVRMFRDSIAADSIGAPDEPSWDIDVRSYETHARVEFYVNLFKGSAKDRFSAWLTRGSRYDEMIRRKLREGGLPEDMTYLALIESGYNPHAYSRAAAVGIWQFMTATARGTGLRVDWWVDERRDPVRSTDAAVKFLGWLHEQFGSLYLAAAAYNGGPGRVSRGLTRYADDLEGTSGDDTFFALAEKSYLRSETKDYVPKLIAAALVAKEPARYGLRIEKVSPFVFDTFKVGPSTPLTAVAKASGASLATIMELNSHVLRGLTPPADSFVVRIPTGSRDSFGAAFGALSAAERTAFTRVTTKKDDTRDRIAGRHDVSTKQLLWYNRSLKATKRGRLVAGQTVLIPSPAVVAAALDVPDPAVERYGSGGGRSATHVVKRGESLGLIARKYRTSVAQLKRLNRLKKGMIFPGQVIVVSGSGSRSAARSATGKTGRASSNGSNGTAAARRVHVVKSGESLGGIARKYGSTVARIQRLNSIKGTAIRAGQKLIVG
ncbi:MAG: LysM peptidoglycan-binding domain-containing protein [Anaerolineae bacterium]|nr:LysM peptidoglycan-binding domain-containing protein [Gemmatimonadaceae bacterium]